MCECERPVAEREMNNMDFDIADLRIGVIGLGYVGLPLAVEFGKKYPTVGFDVNESRIS